MKITIGFSSPNTFKIGAEAIKLWSNRPYSHVLIYWRSETFDRNLVYHAAHGSVHFNSIQTFNLDNSIIKEYEMDITTDQYIKLVTKCIDLAGSDYSKLELLKIFIKDVADRCGFKLNEFSNSPGYICSELLGELLLDLGAKFDRPTFLLRPDHIEDSLIEMLGE